MNLEQSMIDILARWERARKAGVALTAEQLCAEQPEMLDEVRTKIAALESMDKKFGSLDTYDTVAPSSAAHQETPYSGHLSQRNLGGEVDDFDNIDATIHLGSQYRVQEFFARGGLGELFRARDTSLGRHVALKVLQRPLDADPQRRKRFFREAAITGRLEHPGVAPVYGVGENCDGRLCYAMRFIEGETLAQAANHIQKLRTAGQAEEATLALRRLLARFVSVCNTIAFAHSHGILHRDIKPANIILGSFGETFVIDWGLAKALTHADGIDIEEAEFDDIDSPIDDGQLTQLGMIIGTPAFMSPEQAASKAEIGTAADIYGLGATLFYLLTGRTPVNEESLSRLLDRVRNGEIDRPRELVPSISRPLEAICLKALALQPEQRYQSAMELAGDVERFLADQAVSAYQENAWQRIARVVRRNRTLAQSIAMFLVGLSLITTVFAITMYYQRQAAQAARNEATELAKREAASRKIAQEQSTLSLQTLNSVVVDIQRKLSNVSGAVEARRSMLATAIAGLERVTNSLISRDEVDRNMLIALNDIGGIYLTVGQSTGKDATQQALACFERSLDMAIKLAKGSSSSDAQRDLSVTYEKLGDTYWQLGQIEQAEAAYRQSFEISEQMNHNGEFNRDLAFGYMKMGDVGLERGDQDAALAAYERARELFLLALEQYPNNALLKRDIIVAMSKIGNICQLKGSLDEAIAAYTQCIERQRVMITEPNSPVSRRDISVMYNKLGSTLQLQKDTAAAETAFKESLALAREHLADEPQNGQRRRDVTISLNNLGSLYVNATRIADARAVFEESLAMRKSTFDGSPDSLPAAVDLAYILLQVADLESLAERKEVSKQHLSAAREILEPFQTRQLLQTAFAKELYETITRKLAE